MAKRGRPPKPGWVQLHAKLPEDLIARLDAQAGTEERTRSDLLADGGEMYLRSVAKREAKEAGAKKARRRTR